MSTDLSDAVDLLVHLGAVVVALLAGARHAESNARRMPCANARNFAQAFVRLALQLARVPARRHACRQQNTVVKERAR